MDQQNDDSAGVTLPDIASALVGRVLNAIPISKEDLAVLDFLENSQSAGGTSVFQVISDAGYAITPGLWVFFIQSLIYNWSKSGKKMAVMLPVFRERYRSDGEAAANDLLDAAADTLESLSSVDYEGTFPNDEATLAEMLGSRMIRLAEAVENIGDSNLAYDVAAMGLDLLSASVRSREGLAKYALRLAITADKADQVAASSAALAASIAAAADSALERRVEAFDAFGSFGLRAREPMLVHEAHLP